MLDGFWPGARIDHFGERFHSDSLGKRRETLGIQFHSSRCDSVYGTRWIDPNYTNGLFVFNIVLRDERRNTCRRECMDPFFISFFQEYSCSVLFSFLWRQIKNKDLNNSHYVKRVGKVYTKRERKKTFDSIIHQTTSTTGLCICCCTQIYCVLSLSLSFFFFSFNFLIIYSGRLKVVRSELSNIQCVNSLSNQMNKK